MTAQIPQSDQRPESAHSSEAAQCSLFKNIQTAKNPATVSVDALLRQIRDGKWRKQVEKLRGWKTAGTTVIVDGKEELKYDVEKKHLLPTATFQGIFSYRHTDSFLAPSGIFPADIDDIDPAEAKAKFWGDPYLIACYTTSGDDGVRALFRAPKVSTAEEYYYVFDCFKRYVFDRTGYQLDESRKDLAGLANMSYDPDILLQDAVVMPIDWETWEQAQEADRAAQEAKAAELKAARERLKKTLAGNGNLKGFAKWKQKELEFDLQWIEDRLINAQPRDATNGRHQAYLAAGMRAASMLAGYASTMTSVSEIRSLVEHTRPDVRGLDLRAFDDMINGGKAAAKTESELFLAFENWKLTHQTTTPDAGPPPPAEAATAGPPVDTLLPRTTVEVKDGFAALRWYELSEHGTRQRYLDQYGALIRYNHVMKEGRGWMTYQGGRWVIDDRALAKELVTRLIAGLDADATRAKKMLVAKYEKDAGTPYTTTKERSKKEKIRLKSHEATKTLLGQIDPLMHYASQVKAYCFAAKQAMKTTVNHITSLVSHDQGVAVTETDFDRDPYQLNCLNGTLNLQTGVLAPHRPGDHLSKMAGTDYTPGASCPEFLKFLNMIFEGKQDVIAYVQRCFGYSLTGLSDEKVLLFCYGAQGDNGKSTLFNTVKMVLGDYFQTAQAEILMEQRRAAGGALEGLANLKAARCVVTDELSGRSMMDDATVKRLTGADHEIKARKLYGHEFTFSPSHTLWMFGNEKPRVRSADQALWNRMKTIPFDFSIPRQQQKPMEQVMATFRAEAPGILNWMLDGWRVYQSGVGLNADVPDVIQAATDTYRAESDVLKHFVEEMFQRDEQAKERRADVWAAYKTWCIRYREQRVKQSEFLAYLEKQGFVFEEGRSHQWYIHGLTFQVADVGEN